MWPNLCERSDVEELNPDPAERKREYMREYRKANRAKRAEYMRRWRAANPEKALAIERRSLEANRDKRNERARQRYAANRDEIQARQLSWRQANRQQLREYHRRYYAENRQKLLEQGREYYVANRQQALAVRDRYRRENLDSFRRYGLRYTHGLDRTARAEMLQQQDGKCYLCKRDLDLAAARVEHWHGCAGHSPKRSCPSCRRGLACHQCNVIIGFAGEDPERLRQIAASLEIANRIIRERQAAMQVQLELWEN